jgi:hypothetical protein
MIEVVNLVALIVARSSLFISLGCGWVAVIVLLSASFGLSGAVRSRLRQSPPGGATAPGDESRPIILLT